MLTQFVLFQLVTHCTKWANIKMLWLSLRKTEVKLWQINVTNSL